MLPHVRSEDPPQYLPVANDREAEDKLVADALRVLAARFSGRRQVLAPSELKDYLRLKYAQHDHECFIVLFLDSQNCIIVEDEMFRGTVNQTSVYPREVVKRALAVNASGVILCHNHPSGHCAPSRADEFLTKTLQDALRLVDVRVLDHLVVAGLGVTSFVENGLL